MKQLTRLMGRLLLLCALLPLCGSCTTEDDVVEIFTGKTWKLTRLTNKNSSARFLSTLWSDEQTYNKSITLLDQEGNYTLVFEGLELNGEVIDATFSAKAINSRLSGSWDVDGGSKALSLSGKVTGSDSDPLAKAFINGLQKVFKYEGDTNSLTLYYQDGQVTRVMGFIAQ